MRRNLPQIHACRVGSFRISTSSLRCPLAMLTSMAPAFVYRFSTCSGRSTFSVRFVARYGLEQLSSFHSPTDASQPRRLRSGSHCRGQISSAWLPPICDKLASTTSVAALHNPRAAIPCGQWSALPDVDLHRMTHRLKVAPDWMVDWTADVCSWATCCSACRRLYMMWFPRQSLSPQLALATPYRYVSRCSASRIRRYTVKPSAELS